MREFHIVFADPHAGGHTFCHLLNQMLPAKTINLAEDIRQEVRSGSDLGKNLKTVLDSGQLVPLEMIHQLIQNQLNQGHSHITIRNYPRSAEQLTDLFAQLNQAGITVIKVWALELQNVTHTVQKLIQKTDVQLAEKFEHTPQRMENEIRERQQRLRASVELFPADIPVHRVEVDYEKHPDMHAYFSQCIPSA